MDSKSPNAFNDFGELCFIFSITKQVYCILIAILNLKIPLIPIFAVLIISGLTYGFDLACNFLVRTKITYYHSYQQFREKTANLFTRSRGKSKEKSFDFSTIEQENKLRKWLEDPPGTFPDNYSMVFI